MAERREKATSSGSGYTLEPGGIKAPGYGLYELPSGFVHAADSISGGPGGLYVEKFGAPTEPREGSFPGIKKSEGITGKQGGFFNRQLQKGGR